MQIILRYEGFVIYRDKEILAVRSRPLQFPWVLLTTFVLNMDRTNLSNAISYNLSEDLGFTRDTVNLGTAIYSVLFSLACLGGAVVCKIIHPVRWIPLSMFWWGVVTMSHALIKNRSGFFTGFIQFVV
ncbi:hypothetical protein J3R30DRAFT_2363686 [Lentinula aciculospora]|uniref:MFS general substrate transporter n=1 Tax=Lentinula aciculospora TaxID=153920 RepID=A0A9W9DQC5_9AGAR|nr:hypothetical protein J3R30DRAFT_2363686 [Lentinula aciculospora]